MHSSATVVSRCPLCCTALRKVRVSGAGDATHVRALNARHVSLVGRAPAALLAAYFLHSLLGHGKCHKYSLVLLYFLPPRRRRRLRCHCYCHCCCCCCRRWRRAAVEQFINNAKHSSNGVFTPESALRWGRQSSGISCLGYSFSFTPYPQQLCNQGLYPDIDPFREPFPFSFLFPRRQ